MRLPTPASRVITACAATLVVGVGFDLQAARRQAHDAAKPIASSASASEVLGKYCVTCHNSRLKTAGLELDTLDVEQVAGNEAAWEKIVTKLRTGEMPPPGRPRPDAATYSAVAAALERGSMPRPRRTRIRAACPSIA